MTEPYDELAENYHWLLPDPVLAGQSFMDRYGPALRLLRPGARILDCACGTGGDAIALARSGFAVWGADGSPGMVATARRRGREAGVDVDFAVSTWEELPQAYSEPFDAVFCVGNSISHALGERGMTAALNAMRAAVRPGGLVVIDSRNWEKLRAEPSPVMVLDPRTRGDIRCIPVYFWTLSQDWNQPGTADILLLLETEDRVTHAVHRLTFHPFALEELHRRMSAAGLEVRGTQYWDSSAWYAVTATRAGVS